MSKESRPVKVLAVSSGGGHWTQMMRLRPAFADTRILYASVDRSRAQDVAPAPFVAIPDANRDQKLRLFWLLARMVWIVIRFRPDVVVSTGAAPGYFAVRLGRMLGARTLFLDSIANAEKLSLSARLAQKHSDLLLTQWPHLAEGDRPGYSGTVL